MSNQVRDEFNEAEYSPVLYDQKLVMEMLRATITEKRTNKKFVIIDGLCNAHKFLSEEERLELRNMDELWQIERHFGEIKAIIGLQFMYEPETIDPKEVDQLEFQEDPAAQEKPADQPPADAEGAGEEVPKAKSFNPKEFNWTKTDRKPKNLP